MSRPLNPWKLSGYKAGQNVICKVMAAEPGGYAVIIPKDNLPGFLPTQVTLKVGQEILTQYVCVHNNRILLSARFANTGNQQEKTPIPSVNWEDHLDQLEGDSTQSTQGQDAYAANADPAYNQEYAQQSTSSSYQGYTAPPAPAPTQTPQAPASYASTLPSQSFAPNSSSTATPVPVSSQPPQLHYQAPPQAPTPSVVDQAAQDEADLAFQVWAPQMAPRRFHLKRAIDLVMPPVNSESINTFKIADYDLEWLITDLEGGMRTGCVKASSETVLSRSAMLLYRGRAVGCIYGCKANPETQPTESSLQLMLHDLRMPDTVVSIYDLPEAAVLAMSSLFLGYPVQREDNYDARSYLDYICSWLEERETTGCLAISLPGQMGTCLGYVHNGRWSGSFYVEDQRYTNDKNFVYDLLRSDPQANVEASILPPEMTSSAVRFGYSLSMACQRSA